MKFNERLNTYMKEIGCTNKELAEAGKLGTGTISRYRTGERTPDSDSEQIRRISEGLATLAARKKLAFTEPEILRQLKETLDEGFLVDHDTYLSNLNTLLEALEIKGVDLAHSLHHDPSLISRILSGQRRPSDKKKFTYAVASYIVKRYGSKNYLPVLSTLFKCTPEEISQDQTLLERTVQWLGTNAKTNAPDPFLSFLEKLDSFNLDDYIQAIHFHEIKIPTVPFHLPTTKEYRGLTQMMESEIDFIRATVLSRTGKDVILYSDMPMEEMAKDPGFPKKWMFGMAMMLRKGLHLHIIHDVNRPFREMMLGLESNIPMYMTGQISPYYLKTSQSDVFTHLLKVSGSAALFGTAIAGHHEKGRYVLTKAKEEVAFYQEQAKDLLSKASPLMQIYRKDQQPAFEKCADKLWQSGDRRMVFSSLPLFTIPEDLLLKILKRCRLSPEDTQRIRAHRSRLLSNAEKLLRDHSITVEIPQLTQIAFQEESLHLDLSELFYEQDILYTYEEYAAHLKATQLFAQEREHLTLKTNQAPAFRNISFTIIKNKCVIVSKDNSPTIHFVIHHPKMVSAFSSFIPPYTEAKKGRLP